ncbi:MAG: hypothetical protein JOZ10_19620 [Acidobacteria bacterium]|nr:hypothetical protein [Acidobacteriota bacterium]
MRQLLVLVIILLTGSGVAAEHNSAQCAPQNGFFIAIGYARLQSPHEAYIFGATNLPSGSVLAVACRDFMGKGSHTVSKDAAVTVAPNGLFQVSVVPEQSYEFKNNMICDVTFHAWQQQAVVLKITGRNGERLGDGTTNSQVLTYSGGQYLEAVTVLHG